MKRLIQHVLASLTTVSMLFVLAASNVNASDEDLITIDIDVAPNVLNIQSKSVIVTVHTDIAYSLVAGASVYLNEVAIEWWKSDNQGNFVAKFDSDEVKALVDSEDQESQLFIGEYNELTLEGFTKVGVPFIGFQDIFVVNIEPKGNKN